MKNKRKLVYQQHLDLQFPLTQQLGLDLDAPVDQRIEYYVDLDELTTIDAVWASGTMSSYLTVSNSNGDEAARIEIQESVLEWKSSLG